MLGMDYSWVGQECKWAPIPMVVLMALLYEFPSQTVFKQGSTRPKKSVMKSLRDLPNGTYAALEGSLSPSSLQALVEGTGNAHCVLQHCTFSRTELVLSEHYKQRLLHPNGVDGFLPKVAVVVVRHRWPSCYSHLLRLGWGKSSLPGGKNPHGFCSAMATVSGHMSLEGRSTPYRG